MNPTVINRILALCRFKPNTKVTSEAARRFPRWGDFRPFLRLRPVHFRRVDRQLARCQSVSDLERLAIGRVPKSVFEYVSGGAEEEISLRLNREVFQRVTFTPSAFRQTGAPDTSVEILGRRIPLPLILAPTGFTRLSHHLGEVAAASAASAAKIPYTLSTYSTTSISDIGNMAAGRNWFQLYLMRDREFSRAHLEEAKAAGFESIMITIDTTMTGQRRRDFHNGFDVPPQLTPRTLLDMAIHPEWVFNLLTTSPLRFATFAEGDPNTRWGMSNSIREQALRPADLEWLREVWDGPIIVKGILSEEDAHISAEAGMDAVVISNHGGRQLDRSPVPLELLPRIADEVGDKLEVYLDSGVRTGADIAAALGLGAKAVLIGRPYLYGLMVGGTRGVTRCIEMLHDDLVRTMCLIGTPTIADISRNHVRLR